MGVAVFDGLQEVIFVGQVGHDVHAAFALDEFDGGKIHGVDHGYGELVVGFVYGKRKIL